MEKKNFDHLKTKAPQGELTSKCKNKKKHSIIASNTKPDDNPNAPIEIYCNQLIIHPKNHEKPFIKNFLQLFFKNFVPKPEDQNKLKKVIFTTFGFEAPLIVSMANKGVKVSPYYSNA